MPEPRLNSPILFGVVFATCSRWSSEACARNGTFPSSRFGWRKRRNDRHQPTEDDSDLQYRPLGKTGLPVSVISFGAGPVSGLMQEADDQVRQVTICRAVELGINWFDTAPGYAQGDSERNLGRAIVEQGFQERIQIATKVRLSDSDLANVSDAIRRSVLESRNRLGGLPITLLQLHNSITAHRGDEPSSLTPTDVLRPHGVLDTFLELQQTGSVRHIGLTGIGQPEALREVVLRGSFETIQTPYSLLNRTACETVLEFAESNYGNLIANCTERNMGVLAIRVFAAGSLLGNPPSSHTRRTPYFPLELYERDRQRADRLRERLGTRACLRSLALQFVLENSRIASAIIGFASPSEVRDVCLDIDSEPITDEIRTEIADWWRSEKL
jgi:aryl-alcohol dehydrogenase-like predicted oxidoreductase